MKLKFVFISYLLSTIAGWAILHKSAAAQRCWVEWQVDNPLVKCEAPPTTFNSPSYVTGRRIILKNSCPNHLRLAIRIQDPSDNWVTLGWWIVLVNDEISVSADSQDIRTRSPRFYVYAESLDGRQRPVRGSYLSSFGRRSLHMAEKMFSLNPEGDFSYNLTCKK